MWSHSSTIPCARLCKWYVPGTQLDPVPGRHRPELALNKARQRFRAMPISRRVWGQARLPRSSHVSTNERPYIYNQTLWGQYYLRQLFPTRKLVPSISGFCLPVHLVYNLLCTTEPGWFYAGAKGGATAEVEPAAPL